jgi:hypothetical protein
MSTKFTGLPQPVTIIAAMGEGMDRKTKAKWFFLGLTTGWTSILTVAVFIFVQVNRGDPYDPFGGVRPDMGERVHERWRLATGEATVMPLGDTAFVAVVGPSRYTDKADKDWDYYTVSVQRPEGDSSYVFFKRQFRMDAVPAELVNKEAKDITIFDENSGVVTFMLETSTHAYKLPNR